MSDATLILGLAAGYHYGDVRPFLTSLERAGYQGECVLFVSETTRDLDRMGLHNVTIIPLERRAGLESISYNALRYFLYQEYLNSCEREFDRIMISDVRDVIFQRNPFSFPWSTGLNIALEDSRIPIGSCPYNAHWIRQHLGETALSDIKNKTISCSGTTVGDSAAMLDYLAKMTDNLISFEGGERMAGYDQGVHNWLVHTGQIPVLTMHENSDPILTLGYTQGEPALDREGDIRNEAGERIHIVHQYDRKPALFKTIRSKYAV